MYMFLRINTEYDILGGITQAEIISSILVLVAVLGIYFLNGRSKK